MLCDMIGGVLTLSPLTNPNSYLAGPRLISATWHGASRNVAGTPCAKTHTAVPLTRHLCTNHAASHAPLPGCAAPLQCGGASGFHLLRHPVWRGVIAGCTGGGTVGSLWLQWAAAMTVRRTPALQLYTRFALHVARKRYGIEVSEGMLAAMPPADMFAQPPPQADVQAVVNALEQLPEYQPHQCAFVHHTPGQRPRLCVALCSVCLSVHAGLSARLLLCFSASA